MAITLAAVLVCTAASTRASSVRAYSAVHEPAADRLTTSPCACPTRVPAATEINSFIAAGENALHIWSRAGVTDEPGPVRVLSGSFAAIRFNGSKGPDTPTQSRNFSPSEALQPVLDRKSTRLN